jgi:glycosyltransferase involved in cell wall biosynthesis
MDSYVSKHQLGSKVMIHDSIGVENLVGRLHWCDYLVIPSRVESIPVILSDAVQLGTPIIATEVGDIRNILAEMNIGQTVPSQEPHKLADMLLDCRRRDGTTRDLNPGLRYPMTSPTDTAKSFLRSVGLLPASCHQQDARSVATTGNSVHARFDTE